ncbi:MAG: hypothetical protein ACLFN8_02610 [Candidatus Woesearchaeota archaeon]
MSLDFKLKCTLPTALPREERLDQIKLRHETLNNVFLYAVPLSHRKNIVLEYGFLEKKVLKENYSNMARVKDILINYDFLNAVYFGPTIEDSSDCPVEFN